MPRPRLTASIAALACAAGCAGPAPTGPAPSGPPRPKTPAPSASPLVAPPTAAPLPVVTLPPPVPTTPGIISDQGLGLVSDQGASLTGLVRAPAQVVSTGGGGVVSTGGGGIVGNNGGGYRLAAAPDQPLVAGAAVDVVDATGAPVLGPDGKPLSTTTGSNGRYRFDVPIPGHNVLVRVDLGAKGALTAIAPPPPAGGTGRVADLDLVSSLTTTYILDQYVRPQAEQVAVLDKLPGDVEAVTRARAADALAAGDVAALPALTPVALVATVDALRAANPAFDAQLEVVKKLLVAAGQSDLGAGRPGTEVALLGVRALRPTPEGLLIATGRRLWRLGPDGLMRTVAGAGSRGEIAGKPAAEAGLVSLEGLAVDAAGRLLMFERAYDDANGRIARLEADGTLSSLYDVAWDVIMPEAMLGEVDGQLQVLARRPAAVYAVGAGNTLTKQYELPEAFIANATTQVTTGRDAQGRLYVARTVPTDTVVNRWDPVAKAGVAVAKVGEAGVTSLALDAAGNVFVRDAAGKLEVIAPDGARRTLAAAYPDALTIAGAGLAPDGGAWLATDQHVYRLAAGGTRTLVAGTPASEPKPGQAADFAFQIVAGLAPLPGGELVAADSVAGKLVAFKPKGAIRVLADGLDKPMWARTDAAGDVWFASGGVIRKRDHANGAITAAATPEFGLDDMVVTPDGALWWSERKAINGPDGTYYPLGRVMRRAPDGAVTQVHELTAEIGAFYLAVAADGAVHAFRSYSTGDKIWRCTADAPATLVPGTPKLRCQRPGRFAMDAKGRYYSSTDYVGSYSEKIQRWDPATGAEALIAGPGGRAFTGEGVDDGIKTAGWLTFAADGTLFFGDVGHAQVKGIPADVLDN